jgi:hypothetical protein
MLNITPCGFRLQSWMVIIVAAGAACLVNASPAAAKIDGHVSCERMCGIYDLRLSGKIEADDVRAFQNLIDTVHREAGAQHKQLEYPMMQANSPGGSVDAAMAIGRIVRRESIGITVDPNDICASACVLIFAGAVLRSHAMNLGIHRPYLEAPSQQITETNVKQYYGAMLDRIRAYLHEMNVAEGLADAMLRIPPEEVHFLTFDEADAYGLTIADPVFQETMGLKKAQQLGLDRQEYVRRNTLANRDCHQPGAGADLAAMRQWTSCIEQTLKTGHVGALPTPDFSRYGTPAPGR